jgi:phosphatidylserine/phosphatidylglycerophosphate/cardiolipin synthase-like enzyme
MDMNTGQAVALHFAGLYMIENYAVPASTIKKYLKNRPWHGESVPVNPTPPAPAPVTNVPNANGSGENGNAAGQVSITIPLQITVSLGTPQLAGTLGGGGVTANVPTGSSTAAAAGVAGIESAAQSLHRQHGMKGVYSVWAGYEIKEGRLTDNDCIVASADPSQLENVRRAMPESYSGYPVEVRPASIDQQMEALGILEAPATSVQYNDADRTGPGFSFNWVDEEMKVLLHVGPERSWVVLSEFLKDAQHELVSSIYEFHAAHIANAIEKELDDGATLKLVMAVQSRDQAKPKEGDFVRRATFDRWKQQFAEKFDRIFVPLGPQGLVANAYHIKVTVADGNRVWLSSGNWKDSSQPVIPSDSLNNPKVTGAAGNREWHAVIENPTLAKRFRNHISADFERSLALGGTPESLADEIMVDVPLGVLEAIELEGAPARVIEPLQINRRVRVKPLLTPDKKGGVFSRAVLQLIRSAESQLVFQNQYIKMSGADSGFLKQLVDALAEKAQELDDFRIILRSGGQDMDFDLSQLKRRGIDVNNQVRILANTHTKGIVVDGTRVLIGSHNWSGSGVTLNRDASLIFDDEEIAQYYLEVFELDWDRAREAHLKEEAVTEGVRPATGDAPPPGFVRMPLSSYLEG